MKCLTDEELADQATGFASPGRKEAARAHLGTCEACRGRLAALKAAATAAAAVPPAPVSADFTARLMARVAEENASAPVRERARPLVWLRLPELAFAACALTLLLAAYFKAGRAPSPSEAQVLYMTDGPATAAALASLPYVGRPAGGAGPDEVLYTDACLTARCGL